MPQNDLAPDFKIFGWLENNNLGVPLTYSPACSAALAVRLVRSGRALRSSTARMHSQYVRCDPSRKKRKTDFSPLRFIALTSYKSASSRATLSRGVAMLTCLSLVNYR
jgi:hypothetical protein